MVFCGFDDLSDKPGICMLSCFDVPLSHGLLKHEHFIKLQKELFVCYVLGKKNKAVNHFGKV